MDVVLIHNPIGPLPPEMLAASLEAGKKVNAEPASVVPGGKLVSSYQARGTWSVFCIWEVPTVEALMPLMEQMKMLGWNTEVIPVDKAEVAQEKAAKALEALAG